MERRGQGRLPARAAAADHRGRGRIQRLPHPRLEGRTRDAGRPDRPGPHGLPFPAGDIEVEPDRAPIVLPHHPQLAGQANDQPRSRDQHDRGHQHPHRTASACRTGHRHLPTRSPDQQRPDGRPAHHPTPLHGEWNYTLHPDTDGHTSQPDPLPPLPQDTTTLADPTLTGLSRPDLDTLTTALDTLRATRIQARHRQHQQHRAEQGLRPREPRSGRPPRLSFPDQVLATVLHMRLSLPEDTVGTVFGCSRSTIRRAITETRRLLAEHGTTIEPVTLPVPLPDPRRVVPPVSCWTRGRCGWLSASASVGVGAPLGARRRPRLL